MTFSAQTQPMPAVLAGPWRPHADQRAATEPAHQARPHAFATRNRLHQYYLYIFTNPRLSWAFKPNGKAGTSSVLAFLHRLEFGVPITTACDDAFNPDQIVHRLADAQLFAQLPAHPDVTDAQAALDATLRLTVVRHPAARAVSGFRYLCRAHATGAAAFTAQRLRMSVLTGFDWERDCDTADGFLRYLDWVAAEQALGGWMADSHFRPQVVNIRPEILQPHVVGRTEDMATFFRAVCARLDRPLPAGAEAAPPRNRQPGSGTALLTRAARARIADVFAADFDAFAYDPQEPCA